MEIVSENQFSGKTYLYTIASRWYRRDDLKGATVINSLSPFLCWADFTKDENGKVTGSEGYFQARKLQ